MSGQTAPHTKEHLSGESFRARVRSPLTKECTREDGRMGAERAAENKSMPMVPVIREPGSRTRSADKEK